MELDHSDPLRSSTCNTDGLQDMTSAAENAPSLNLQAQLRVRPVTIRFTEPGVSDLSLDIQALTSLDGDTELHDGPSSIAPGPTLLFDFDAEDTSPALPASAKGKGKATDHDEPSPAMDQIRSALEHVLGEETIREIKYRIRHERSALNRRRLRLIHAGRILRDGIRLVSWLDGLDEHRRLQSKTLQELAFEASVDAGSDSSSDTSEGDSTQEKDEVRSESTLVGTLLEAPEGPVDLNSKGKQKQKEPDWYAHKIRVTRRIAPRLYLQCSVGDTMQPGEEDGIAPPTFGEEVSAPAAGDNVPASRAVERGFDRLADAGLSPQEIEEIRSQFRSTLPITGSGEALRHQEEQEHLLAMEDQWMESFDLPSASSASYLTVLEGLMAGFFLPPLLPLFYFTDKTHPSCLPRVAVGSASGPTSQDEQDDQDLYEQEQSDLASNIVFSKTMQISIIFGIVANLMIGTFRWIW